MIRCLEDKTLFLLSEGEAGEEQRSHLQSCRACTERYHEIERDLRLITQTLHQKPPPLPVAAFGAPIAFRFLPIAAGVLLAIALMWGESRLWRPDSSSEQRFSSDVSQFLEQVSDAIFDGGSTGEVEPASSDFAGHTAGRVPASSTTPRRNSSASSTSSAATHGRSTPTATARRWCCCRTSSAAPKR